MDGYVTIKTELDTKDFDSQIKEVEYKLEQIEFELSHKKELKLDERTITQYNAKAEKLRNQLADLRKKQMDLNKQGYSNMLSSLDGVGNSVDKITRKVVRWGLAIFSVRSMYNLVRQSVSTLSQYDDQMSADIEYIRYAIANALKPVIEAVLNLVKQLLFYVNYLAKAWFNVDLFAKASNKDFAKSNKQAKALSKTLASFDEANILSDSGSTDTSTGSAIPSFDLSDTQGMKIPKWLEWIKDHGKEIAAAIGLIIGSKLLGTGLLGLTGLASTLASIGIIAIGVDLFYKALTGRDLIKDLEDIYNGLKDISEAKRQNEKDDKKVHDSMMTAIEDNKNLARTYEAGGIEVGKYQAKLESAIDVEKAGAKFKDKTIGMIIREIEEIGADVEAYKDLYEQGKLNNEQTKRYIDYMGKLGLNADGTKMSFKQFADFLKTQYDKEIDDASEKTSIFGTGLIDLVKNNYQITIDTKFNEPDTTSFKGRINQLLENIGKSFGALGGVGIKIPRLARGGIVNNPGAGVMMGGYIAGEKGAEAVLPLTDDTLQRLANMIPITVQVNNSMNGRVISREIQKVQNQTNFALNR